MFRFKEIYNFLLGLGTYPYIHLDYLNILKLSAMGVKNQLLPHFQANPQ